jgi:hypothetical protein
MNVATFSSLFFLLLYIVTLFIIAYSYVANLETQILLSSVSFSIASNP